MLRTNLSTRPFYNIRAVQVTLGAMALLVIVLTLLNLVQLIRLTSSVIGKAAFTEDIELAIWEEATGLFRSQSV